MLLPCCYACARCRDCCRGFAADFATTLPGDPDKEYDGEMWTRAGLRVKYLPQEPDLDSSLNVMENIRRGIAEQVLRVLC